MGKKVAKGNLLTQMEIIKMESGPMINFNLAQSKSQLKIAIPIKETGILV
jgi:hypothetical protein